MLSGPTGLAALPSSGVLYVADRNNHRVRQLACVPCPASYFCGSGSPVLCPAGSYCPLYSVTATPCPAGTYGNATGAASLAACSACPPGTHSAVVGAALSSTCSPCAAGRWSAAAGAPSAVACAACSAGTFSAPGATACAFSNASCPAGTFASGAAACAPCVPASACPVGGLAAQPTCFWNVSTLAGGAAGWTDAQGTAAKFTFPWAVAVDPATLGIIVGDTGNQRVRRVSPAGLVGTLAGSGVAGSADGLGAAATFSGPFSVRADALGTVYVLDATTTNLLRKVLPSGLVTTLAGTGAAGTANGIGTSAAFTGPMGIALDASGIMGYVVEQTGCRIRAVAFATLAVTTLAGSGVAGFFDSANGLLAQFANPASAAWHPSGVLYVADSTNDRIRSVNVTSAAVATLAGSGVASSTDGVGTSATFNNPMSVQLDATFTVLYVLESTGQRMRSITLSSAQVRTLVGGAAGFADGFGTAAMLSGPTGLAALPSSGVLYIADRNNHRVRQLACAPCPASYFCGSGSPVICPAGSFCPMYSMSATTCPPGRFSAIGASSCSPCPAGSFTTPSGSATCQQCPGGHFCPSGTASWAHLSCGRGNYCPDGSGAPLPCPIQVPPSGGWGSLEVQGPAFVIETSHCLNHCFWNFTSGNGLLSKC